MEGKRPKLKIDPNFQTKGWDKQIFPKPEEVIDITYEEVLHTQIPATTESLNLNLPDEIIQKLIGNDNQT